MRAPCSRGGEGGGDVGGAGGEPQKRNGNESAGEEALKKWRISIALHHGGDFGRVDIALGSLLELGAARRCCLERG